MAEQPPVPEKATWRITGVRDSTLMTPGQGFVPSKVITVELWDKSTFEIEVPRAEFTVENVSEKVEEQIKHEIAVRMLQGPPLASWYQGP